MAMYELYMLDKIGEPAMLEQLAEECTELAKAALKEARILRGENPTSSDLTLEKAKNAVTEEYTDVVQCVYELGIGVDLTQMNKKHERFLQRWEKHVEEQNC